MVIDLTAGIAVGLAIGWGLDWLIGSAPLFMIVFVLLGFAAGIRVMLQSAARFRDAQTAAKAGTEPTGAGAPENEGR